MTLNMWSPLKRVVRVPGFLIPSIEAPINFANTNYLNERISRWAEEYEAEEDPKRLSGIRYVILELSVVCSIDTSGVSILMDLGKSLDKKDLDLVLVNPTGEVMEKLNKADEAKVLIGPDSLFLTVGEAVASLSSAMKYQTTTSSHV